MQNNMSQIIEICKELIWQEAGYSINLINMKSENRFWNDIWIDIVGKTFQERKITIIN